MINFRGRSLQKCPAEWSLPAPPQWHNRGSLAATLRCYTFIVKLSSYYPPIILRLSSCEYASDIIGFLGSDISLLYTYNHIILMFSSYYSSYNPHTILILSSRYPHINPRVFFQNIFILSSSNPHLIILNWYYPQIFLNVFSMHITSG